MALPGWNVLTFSIENNNLKAIFDLPGSNNAPTSSNLKSTIWKILKISYKSKSFHDETNQRSSETCECGSLTIASQSLLKICFIPVRIT